MFTKIGGALVTSDRVLALQPRRVGENEGVEITFDNGQWLVVIVPDAAQCIKDCYEALGTGTTAG